MEELLEIYNEYGEKTGQQVERGIVHKKGLLHKAVCVWIMNFKQELLVQRRSPNVSFPNMLDISFSGHIAAGESAIEAIRREGREELGLIINPQKLRYLFTCREFCSLHEYIENEIDDVFLYQDDIQISDCKFLDNEVSSVEYIPVDKFRDMIENQASELMPYETHYQCLLTSLRSRVFR
ncbi:MAG: NUDIX domain-containing protein [Lachnospiraceae bacterium]|nr:NUDIX domain-containing protein [Lachnospiraceae bacterium]